MVRLLLSLGIPNPTHRVAAWLGGCASMSVAGAVVGLLAVLVLLGVYVILIAARLSHL